MNTPNKLTLLRVVLVPFFLAAYLIDAIPYHYLIALILFTVASLTDLLDGHLARKNGLVTDFGKFMDPLADKMLVTAALIAFVGEGVVSSVAVIIIIIREFTVTSLRLIAAGKGTVIAADIYGKYKTVFQMVLIITLLLELGLGQIPGIALDMTGGWLWWVNTALLGVTVVLTVLSGANYLIKNWNCIREM